MHSPRTHHRALAFTAAAAITLGAGGGLMLTACGDDNGSGGGLSPEELAYRADVSASIATNVILPLYRTCALDLDGLADAVEAWAADATESTAATARDAFGPAWLSWQRCEGLQLGPATMPAVSPGGEDLRDEIYAWPLSNTCRADIATARLEYEGAVSNLLVSTRGLGILEYLLFNESTANTCPPNNAINDGGEWAALTDDEIRQRRADYAAAIARHAATQAAVLRDRWEPDGGNFLVNFTDFSASGRVVRNAQEALNIISNAMFYFEKEVKDMKMAQPAGLALCAAEVCPEALESRWAGLSAEAMAANLETLAALYYGDLEADGSGTALGFDDLLRAIGAGSVADAFEAGIDESRAALAALPRPLDADALAADPDALRDAYEGIRPLTTLLKTQFLSVLDLELPNRAEGDND